MDAENATSRELITQLIPHRPPFLWVDRIISCDEQKIVTEKTIEENLELFQGHYPGNPIMPGVLLCEAIFQSGALLMAKQIAAVSDQDHLAGKVPVLTRILGAKFKRMVRPGEKVVITVTIQEELSNVSYLKGTMKCDGKTAVVTEFACALVDDEEKQA